VPPRSAVPCAQCPDPTLPLIEIPKWLEGVRERCMQKSSDVQYWSGEKQNVNSGLGCSTLIE
jgi:hypothetical protein